MRLFSVQKYGGSEQLKELNGAFPVIDLGSRMDEGESSGPFLDTAAVLKNLDLFVSWGWRRGCTGRTTVGRR